MRSSDGCEEGVELTEQAGDRARGIRPFILVTDLLLELDELFEADEDDEALLLAGWIGSPKVGCTRTV